MWVRVAVPWFASSVASMVRADKRRRIKNDVIGFHYVNIMQRISFDIPYGKEKPYSAHGKISHFMNMLSV